MFDSSNEVKSVDVARYYVKSELGHILRSLNKQIADSEDINNMSEQEVFELCEALSISYRLNSVWWAVGDPKFKWYKAQVPVENVQLTGMGEEELNNVIHSGEINNDPIKLRGFLKKYYANLGYEEDRYRVKPSERPIELNSILLVQQGDKLQLIDGSHRFIKQLMSDKPVVNAFIAKSIQPDERIRPVIGGGVYRNLTNVLDFEEEEREKKTILNAAGLLTKYSGRDNDPLRRFRALADRIDT